MPWYDKFQPFTKKGRQQSNKDQRMALGTSEEGSSLMSEIMRLQRQVDEQRRKLDQQQRRARMEWAVIAEGGSSRAGEILSTLFPPYSTTVSSQSTDNDSKLYMTEGLNEYTVSLETFMKNVQIGDIVEQLPHQGTGSRYKKLLVHQFTTSFGTFPREEVVEYCKELANRGSSGYLFFRTQQGDGWNFEWHTFANKAAEELGSTSMKELMERTEIKAWSKNTWVLPKVVEKKPLTVNIFDKLIIPEANKQEIVSVLKQFEKRDLLMKTWGLEKVIEYGLGMTFLFYGPPGTGKTFIARQIAEALGLKLKVISNAELQSPMPGEYERNLKATFEKAKKYNEVLLFDEADGMIQSRAGMGQIMSSENNCFLQEVEKHEGIVILTTNRVDSLDEALERRIALILEFKNPNFEQRGQIWDKLLPPEMPLGACVEKPKLQEHVLSGGQIKNCVLNAARFAVGRDSDKVEMVDFEKAVERVQKGSKAFSEPRSVRYVGMRHRVDKVRTRSDGSR